MLVLSVVVTLVCPVGAHAGRQRESQLAPGSFPHIAGSDLGKPIDFENMIDPDACFPLIVKWEVVSWIHRAYVAAPRVLVQRCVEFDPSIEQTRGNRHGGVNEAWDRVVAGPGGTDFDSFR